METYDHFTRTGAFDADARVARITVLHNPHAALALDMAAAVGPHDEQWGVVVDNDVATYGPIASGIWAWELPGQRDHPR